MEYYDQEHENISEFTPELRDLVSLYYLKHKYSCKYQWPF